MNYRFNTKVELNYEVERQLNGKRLHLLTVNEMGNTNYYKQLKCESDMLVTTIEIAEQSAKLWCEERENQFKSPEQLVLEGMRFQ
jgi:hypothetical protein